MEDFSLKNRILKEIDTNHQKLKELFENLQKRGAFTGLGSDIGGSSSLLVDQYRRNVSRIFSELEMQENRLKIANMSIVQSLEKQVRAAAQDATRHMEHYDRINYFRGRFRSEVDNIISKRSRLKEEFSKI